MKSYTFVALLFISLSSRGAESSYEDKYEKYIVPINKSTNLAITDKTAKLIGQYDKYFSSGIANCEAGTIADLRARFMAANMLAGYTMFSHFEKNDDYIKDMEICLSKLTSTGMATDKDFNDLFGAYISSREFLSARSLARRNPKIEFPHIPELHIPPAFMENQRSVMYLSPADDLVAGSIPFSPEIKIIVVSGCHFALDALQSVESDERIKEAFHKANALWLVPGDRNLDIASLKEINNSFPDSSTYLAYKNSAWPEIDFSISPNFYFYKDGKLIKKFEGWDGDGIPNEILDVLKEMNLL